MKKPSKLQSVTFELEEIESIEEVGYRNCTDISVEDDESFSLSNGIISHNSAATGISQALGRRGIGYYAGRGVPLNVWDCKVSQMLSNKEFCDITTLLGIDPSKNDNKYLNFDKIVLANDADCLEEHTKILTKDGDKELKDVQYGDLVQTDNGEFKRVVNIVEKESNRAIAININGSTIYASENHRFVVMRDGVLTEVRAKDLKITDLFLRKKLI